MTEDSKKDIIWKDIKMSFINEEIVFDWRCHDTADKRNYCMKINKEESNPHLEERKNKQRNKSWTDI